MSRSIPPKFRVLTFPEVSRDKETDLILTKKIQISLQQSFPSLGSRGSSSRPLAAASGTRTASMLNTSSGSPGFRSGLGVSLSKYERNHYNGGLYLIPAVFLGLLWVNLVFFKLCVFSLIKGSISWAGHMYPSVANCIFINLNQIFYAFRTIRLVLTLKIKSAKLTFYC